MTVALYIQDLRGAPPGQESQVTSYFLKGLVHTFISKVEGEEN
jgi:hypothetical protein